MQNPSPIFARIASKAEIVIVPVNAVARAADPSVPAFFCVHSVSGSAGGDFQELADHLDPDVRLYGIQAPPGRVAEDKFGDSIDELATYYIAALQRFQPQGPYLLGGYCVGAVIAMEMTRRLIDAGQTVGPMIAIDGVPENTGAKIHRWHPRYWADLLRNIRGWLIHADLVQSRTLRSLIWSITNNTYALAKGAIGLKRGQQLGGGYSVDGIVDVSRFSPTHVRFINRLFGALFRHFPQKYPHEIVVYEAGVNRLLSLPQIGRTWHKFAPHAEVVRIIGTHIGMLKAPYVGAIAHDLKGRVRRFFGKPVSGT